MEIAVGLDYTLGLSIQDMEIAAQQTARHGYSSLWFGEGNGGNDGFVLSGQCWAASRSIKPEGITTGLNITPVLLRTPLALAMSARTMTELTHGRFVLGVGAGRAYSKEGRKVLGHSKVSSIELMRDYLTILRGLLSGRTVEHKGLGASVDGARLLIREPLDTPIYLGAVGPHMLRLGGELADGVCLSWNTPELITWSRAHIAEGAARSGRDLDSVKVAAYVRMAVDDDVLAARKALAESALGYALAPSENRANPPRVAYRAQFERMGFGEELRSLDKQWEAGALIGDLAEKVSEEFVGQVGYYGSAEGAAKALIDRIEGLDLAIVRVVGVRRGLEQVLTTLNACQHAIDQ